MEGKVENWTLMGIVVDRRIVPNVNAQRQDPMQITSASFLAGIYAKNTHKRTSESFKCTSASGRDDPIDNSKYGKHTRVKYCIYLCLTVAKHHHLSGLGVSYNSGQTVMPR